MVSKRQNRLAIRAKDGCHDAGFTFTAFPLRNSAGKHIVRVFHQGPVSVLCRGKCRKSSPCPYCNHNLVTGVAVCKKCKREWGAFRTGTRGKIRVWCSPPQYPFYDFSLPGLSKKEIKEAKEKMETQSKLVVK